MSKNFNEIIDELIAVIEASEQYQNYMRLHDNVEKDPELRSKIDEIRNLNFKLSTERNADAAYDELDVLERRFDELSEDKRVFDFIQAESEFVRIYQEVNKRVLDKFKF